MQLAHVITDCLGNLLIGVCTLPLHDVLGLLLLHLSRD